MISTEQLKYNYPGGPSLVFPDFRCESKDVILILGTSGVGKTTLLHLLGGILTTQQGSVNIGGTEINTLSGADLDKFRGKNIGIVFQQNHFVNALTVIENVMLAQSLAGNKTDRNKALALLNRLNIGNKANKGIRDLSQGEKQRVAIARAIINQPKLILADEPTSALDDINCDEVLLLLEEQAKQAGSALIIVTHDTRLKDKIEHRIILQ
ncbi:MAG: ATP-binding cassette domain-containing protein [Saprospiraceae bacterium]|jgi:putative ABC transport system ATP-binding protein|nr:ATP-binding cassette domain-containing protein [Saprospiraceae bacterium]MBL0023618.1 ATP-binding cassette domain-containing protein [Saprospiraceae bacterium]